MKIKEVRTKEDNSHVFVVTFTPNWLERLFGAMEKEVEYKSTGYEFKYGGQNEYMTRDGRRLGNHCSISQAIDRFRRRW